MNQKLVLALALALALTLVACREPRPQTLDPEQIREIVTLQDDPLEDPTCVGNHCVCVGVQDCHAMGSYGCTTTACNSAGCTGEGCTPPSPEEPDPSPPPAPDPN